MITKFDDFKNDNLKMPDPGFNTDIVSDEFWKMVKIANWNAVIQGYKKNPIINDKHREFFKKAQYRVYSKYSYPEVRQFRNECNLIEKKLYDYFKFVWLSKKYNKIMPSDDGYTDLISSIVGKGKTFVKRILQDPKIFLQMAKDEDYAESFIYLFGSEDVYHEIREKYDPFYKEMRKYNL